MQTKRNRVGVIGAGNWGKQVVRTFHALGALGAVGEADTALHPALGAQYPGIPLYADHRDLLKEPVPAVVIATPVSTHYAIAREALLAGKDVLVEKPITMSVAEAADLVALARDRGRILMVGHLLLFQPAVQWLKAYLDKGALGRVFTLYQERLNLGRARAVENALWSLGVHDVAVLLYLMGQPPCRVQATGQRILQPDIEDDVYLHMHFPGGTKAHLHTSWLWPEKRRRLVVLGSEGMLIYDESDRSVTLHRKRVTPDLQSRDDGSEIVFQGSGQPLTLEAVHFLAGVHAHTASPLIDGTQGLEVVRVLELGSRCLAAETDRKEGQEDARPTPGSDPAVP
ncbi:MAG TPA: Gfo/Idh/MocA family oxidoreductase [Symbiobacteriaceae bacterium]|nr:Gfo/Idh/MocA family oxidoreductase [Symbiobacteriaceae bacterium]